ncbi:MAG: hypothetical protein R6V04_06350 [bacterium]
MFDIGKKILIINIILLSIVLAINMDLDIQTSGNFFLKFQQPKYRPAEGTNAGKQTVDSNGLSFDIGLTWNFIDYMSFRTKYRFTRHRTYDYQTASTLYIYGANMYSNITNSSSITGEILYKIYVGNISSYIGLGIDINHIELKYKTYFMNPSTEEIIYSNPPTGYRDMGYKNLVGLILPIGVYLPIAQNLILDLNMNCTVLGFKQWDDNSENYTLKKQNLSGIYFNVGLIYNMKFKVTKKRVK